MNKKQEVLLWIAGMLLSAWVYLRFNSYIEAKEYIYYNHLIENEVNSLIAWRQLIGSDSGYALIQVLQYAIPFLIASFLLIVSLRTRNRKS